MTKKKGRKAHRHLQKRNPKMEAEDQTEDQHHGEVQGLEAAHGHQDHHEPQGMDMVISPSSPPAQDSNVLDLADNPPTISTAARKNPRKRKKPLAPKKRAALQEKLDLLKQKLQPVAFSPNKTLDFSKHETLFKRLGLWDFAHLDFDLEIRSDLLAMLIANYDHPNRKSFVNDVRIAVNRADLARALRLPVKKDKTAVMEDPESESVGFSEESILVIGDFMSYWILLHEDTWMMPEEILNWARLIKEGQLQKIDWAGMIWFMVEKELLDVPKKSGACYYASHLQLLMKYQRQELFIEEPSPVTEVLIEEEEEDDEDALDLVVTRNLEDLQGRDLEKENVGLSLGQDNNEVEPERVGDDDVMDFEESKEEEQEPWFLNGKGEGGEHPLRHCNLTGMEASHCEPPVIKEEEEEEEEEEKYSPPKYAHLERLTSADLIHDMGATNMAVTNGSYGLPVQLLDPSSGELLTSKVDSGKCKFSLNGGNSSMFGNDCKREIDDDEDDIRVHSHNVQQKKMRTDVAWDHTSDYDYCVEQMNIFACKAKMIHVEKERALGNAQMNLEYLTAELQQRNNIIDSLQRNRYEEQQKRAMEDVRIEHELGTMARMLDFYKKALKETNRAFSEYRERYPQPDEPIYKDVAGSGGMVLSTMELEKRQLEREEEERIKRCMIEQKVKSFQQEWFDKFDRQANRFELLHKRLLACDEEIKFLKEKHLPSISDKNSE